MKKKYSFKISNFYIRFKSNELVEKLIKENADVNNGIAHLGKAIYSCLKWQPPIVPF